ncbi:MAG: hypothetical protein IKD75_01630 [Prevotella sp.]|nr:hypothetical protein [Prevotella sp.]
MISTAEARKMRAEIEARAEELTDDKAYEVPYMFPQWKIKEYQTGDRVQYSGTLYKCLQAHTAQADWTPDTAVSLWVRVDDPSIEWPEWRQPQGAADAYPAGAKVSHNGKHWISDVDSNVWEPGVYGWTEQ